MVDSAVQSAGAEPTRAPAESKDHGFRPDIEGLRSIAIIPVLAYHVAQFVSPTAAPGPLTFITSVLGRITGGFLGVDVFFVISGFLITGLLVREAEKTGRVHFGRFYARRARRILPAATVTLLVTLVASLLILPAARAASTAVDVLWAALFNADVHFARSGVDYMGEATAPSPVLHFWSLNDEEKFYVVWPVVLVIAAFAAAKHEKWRGRPAAFLALLAIAIPSLLWSAHLVSMGDPSGYFSALSRAFELAAGGLLAIAMPAVVRLPRAPRVIGALVGVVVIVFCMLTYSSLTPFPGFAALPVVLGTMLVLAGHEDGLAARGLSTPVPRWFGRISYSLYLWHWPILVLAAASTASGFLSPGRALACAAFAILISWASYRWIEQGPRKSQLLRATKPALIFGLVCILGTVGAALVGERVAQAQVREQAQAATVGIVPITKADKGLLYIGDSLTTRGQEPLEAALTAAGWDFTVDGLGGRPVVGGDRPDWKPLCADQPGCGGDLVLQEGPVPATVVIALGNNSKRLAQKQVKAPTATDSGLRNVKDADGRYVVKSQDSPKEVAAQVDRIMSLVPSTTTVYWVGTWFDDALWGNLKWRAQNAAAKAALAKYPNARFLDYAAFVDAASVPYMPDGSHPNPDGMVMRARWIVSQLK